MDQEVKTIDQVAKEYAVERYKGWGDHVPHDYIGTERSFKAGVLWEQIRTAKYISRLENALKDLWEDGLSDYSGDGFENMSKAELNAREVIAEYFKP